MNIQVNEVVNVHHRSNGNGRLMSEKRKVVDTVKVVYQDGAVLLKNSGEVWNVTRKNGVLRTTMNQRRKV